MTIVAIGEILWDIFPDKKILGGAPANFIFYTTQHGVKSILCSAIGDDKNGEEILTATKKLGIHLKYQKVPLPTGTVDISINKFGDAVYTIHENVAWDHIPMSEEMVTLASKSSLIYFGTLAQRNSETQKTIRKFLLNRQSNCQVLFDVNLRQNFYNRQILEYSLQESDFLKINESEMAVLRQIFGISEIEILRHYNLELIILTLGENGNKIISAEGEFFCPAPKVKLVDSVGAGDAFTASFMIHYLKYKKIPPAQEFATKVAAYICENRGATIFLPENLRLN